MSKYPYFYYNVETRAQGPVSVFDSWLDALQVNRPKQRKHECAYCGSSIESVSEKCGQCGAPNTPKKQTPRIAAPYGGVRKVEVPEPPKEIGVIYRILTRLGL